MTLSSNPKEGSQPVQATRDILSWFMNASKADEKAVLEFPTSLSQQQRAQLHACAKGLGLGASSQGYNTERFLSAYPPNGGPNMVKKPMPEESSGTSLSVIQRKEVEQIWGWIKLEGEEVVNDFPRSRIQEMVSSGNFDEKIGALVARHKEADRLCEAAAGGNLELVQEMVAADPELMHVTSTKKNLLALHAACTGSGSSKCTPAEMVQALLTAGAKVNEPDGQGRSALAVCKADGAGLEVRAVIQVLEENGAREIGLIKKKEPAGNKDTTWGPGKGSESTWGPSRNKGKEVQPLGQNSNRSIGILNVPADGYKQGPKSPALPGRGGLSVNTGQNMMSPGPTSPGMMDRRGGGREAGILGSGGANGGSWRQESPSQSPVPSPGPMGRAGLMTRDQMGRGVPQGQGGQRGQGGVLGDPRGMGGAPAPVRRENSGGGMASGDWRSGAAPLNPKPANPQGPMRGVELNREAEMARMRFGGGKDEARDSAPAPVEKPVEIQQGKAVLNDEDYEEMIFRPPTKRK